MIAAPPPGYMELAPHGGPSAESLAHVGLHTRAGAFAAWNAPLRDSMRRRTTLGAVAAGKPLVLVFADYGCTSLCGPALAVTGARLLETGLRPRRDYNLAVLGLDPDAPAGAERRFAETRLGAGSPLLAASALLSGDARAIEAETAALGFGYAYDAQARQFIHPVATFVLTPEGQTTAALSEVALTAPALRVAIRAAAAGRVTGVIDRLAIACHQALSAVGRFDGPVTTALRTSALGTIAAFAGAVGWMAWRARRPA